MASPLLIVHTNLAALFSIRQPQSPESTATLWCAYMGLFTMRWLVTVLTRAMCLSGTMSSWIILCGTDEKMNHREEVSVQIGWLSA